MNIHQNTCFNTELHVHILNLVIRSTMISTIDFIRADVVIIAFSTIHSVPIRASRGHID